jgi:hypothetical protein
VVEMIGERYQIGIMGFRLEIPWQIDVEMKHRNLISYFEIQNICSISMNWLN